MSELTQSGRRRPGMVTASMVLWVTAAVLGVASVVVTLLNLGELRETLAADVIRQLPDAPRSWDAVVDVVLEVLIGGGVLIPLLQGGFALALRSRRRWARTVLIVVGLLGVAYGAVAMDAVPRPVLLGLWTAVGITMAAALAMFLPASNSWFARSAARS